MRVADDEPALRAGIHVGRPRHIGSDYLSVDVNVATCVADVPKGNEVLVSQTACDHLPTDGFALKKLRPFKAKGTSGDLAVSSVSAASERLPANQVTESRPHGLPAW